MNDQTTPDQPAQPRFSTRKFADQLAALDESRAALDVLEDYTITSVRWCGDGLTLREGVRFNADRYGTLMKAVDQAPPEVVSVFDRALRDHHRQRIAEAEAWLTRHGLEVPPPPEQAG